MNLFSGDIRGDLLDSTCAHPTADPRDSRSWWRVDLGRPHVILNITIFNRQDLHRNRIHNTSVYVTDDPDPYKVRSDYEFCTHIGKDSNSPTVLHIVCHHFVKGRYVILKRTVGGSMNFCELVLSGYRFYECPYGLFGLGCKKECHCQDDCDKVTGNCPTFCETGWQKPDCQRPCESGTWGVDCLTRSHCLDSAEICQTENDVCRTGCADGWWDKNCARPCNCMNPYEVCNKFNGVCVSGCREGYAAPTCLELLPSLEGYSPQTIVNSKNLSVSWQDAMHANFYEVQYRSFKNKWEKWTTIGESTTNKTEVELPYINSRYEIRIIPYIRTTISNDVGTFSDVSSVMTGCNTTFNNYCSSLCSCFSDSSQLCVRTSDVCYVSCNFVSCDLFIPHVLTLDFVDISSNEVEINFTISSGSMYNLDEPEVYGYYISYTYNETLVSFISNTTTNVVVSELEDNTSYEFQIMPFYMFNNSIHEGFPSNHYSITTLASTTENSDTTIMTTIITTEEETTFVTTEEETTFVTTESEESTEISTQEETSTSLEDSTSQIDTTTYIETTTEVESTFETEFTSAMSTDSADETTSSVNDLSTTVDLSEYTTILTESDEQTTLQDGDAKSSQADTSHIYKLQLSYISVVAFAVFISLILACVHCCKTTNIFRIKKADDDEEEPEFYKQTESTIVSYDSINSIKQVKEFENNYVEDLVNENILHSHSQLAEKESIYLMY